MHFLWVQDYIEIEQDNRRNQLIKLDLLVRQPPCGAGPSACLGLHPPLHFGIRRDRHLLPRCRRLRR